ncbi:MAG: HAD family phosphatase [Candidatus Obscuribacterales bacterium]|nr:HAD family phosphatase [Candidatus Obscuribacterales bacterium]
MSSITNSPHALIFDMDGLLLDTEGLYKTSWTQAAKESGFDLTGSLYLKLIGITIADCEIVLVEAFGSEFPLSTFRTRAAALYDELLVREGIPLKPGVCEILDWAKDSKLPCGVGTSTDQGEAKHRLGHHKIIDYFEVVIGGDMVEQGKPNPDIFLKVQESLGVPAADCLVLEDAHSGLLAASAGGMRSCLVPDMLPPSEESRSLAEGVFSSLHEVRKWLAQGCPAAKPV